jgi:hypothetical protein
LQNQVSQLVTNVTTLQNQVNTNQFQLTKNRVYTVEQTILVAAYGPAQIFCNDSDDVLLSAQCIDPSTTIYMYPYTMPYIQIDWNNSSFPAGISCTNTYSYLHNFVLRLNCYRVD